MKLEELLNPPLVRPRECYHTAEDECVCALVVESDITLRDLFAGMAMAGFIAGGFEPEGMAAASYRAADVMLRARSGGGE